MFTDVVGESTAGSPQADIRWTNLAQSEIARRMTVRGVRLSRFVVRQLLRRHGFVRRKLVKKKSMGSHPDRNAQFENISRLKSEYLAAGQPVISIDTKKKELIGNFHRNGQSYATAAVETFDHDFPSFADGKVIPHGVYDLATNTAHVSLGTSHDTTEFACDSVAAWWEAGGRTDHPGAERLLILCDGGGSNPARSDLFKADVQSLANRLGLEIRVAHYPPYCSKHNPIEHRVFPHVTRACAGVVFTDVPLVKRLVERAGTASGLRVSCGILGKAYAVGRKAVKGMAKGLRLIRDAVLPKWNYRLLPKPDG